LAFWSPIFGYGFGVRSFVRQWGKEINMNKRLLGAFALSASVLVACSSGSSTGTSGEGTSGTILGGTATTGAVGGADVMGEVEGLQTQLAEFATELEANAPESVQTAFNDVQDELANLVPAASDLTLTQEEVAPVTEAAEEFTAAVTDDGVQLSDEFMDFWSNFSSRIAALAS
jgi:hypothetical protein